MLGDVTRRAGAPSPAPGIGLISTGYHNTDATDPKVLRPVDWLTGARHETSVRVPRGRAAS